MTSRMAASAFLRVTEGQLESFFMDPSVSSSDEFQAFSSSEKILILHIPFAIAARSWSSGVPEPPCKTRGAGERPFIFFSRSMSSFGVLT